MLVKMNRPTAILGVEELKGTIKLLEDKVHEKEENGEADSAYYVGAWWTLQLICYSEYKYPADFMAVFDNEIDQYLKGI